ncbi:MAG TPA: phosphatase PAP2 family protein [Bacillales bacterium]|nr:phosphatase PAP2 family protein [Bacillales bacterium]
MSVSYKRRLFLAVFIVLAVLFTLLSLNYHRTALLNFGHIVQASIYDIGGEVGETLFMILSYLGSGYLAFPLTGLLALYLYNRQARWTASLLVYNLVGVRLLNWGLKTIFARPRPDLEHLIQANYYSFPSGHAMNSTAFFGFLAYLLHRRLKRKGKPTAWVWAAACVLIFLIGLSRVYLGVHFPLDVFGGFLAGGSWLFLTLFLNTFISCQDRAKKTTE